MKRRHLALLLALLPPLIVGCAAPRNDGWSGVPADSMPETLESWDVYWDDDRRVWLEVGSGNRVGADEVPPEAWTFESNAIALRVRASERLNTFRGNPHTLLLRVYQVRDPSGLNRQLETPAELNRLLRRGDDDPDVLHLQQAIIEPGRERLLQIDRVEHARYVVLVAGYTGAEARTATRVIPIPQIYDLPRGRARLVPGNLVDALNPFSSTPPPRPARLSLWTTLGESRIERVEILAR